jgi:hypothetical protein
MGCGRGANGRRSCPSGRDESEARSTHDATAFGPDPLGQRGAAGGAIRCDSARRDRAERRPSHGAAAIRRARRAAGAPSACGTAASRQATAPPPPRARQPAHPPASRQAPVPPACPEAGDAAAVRPRRPSAAFDRPGRRRVRPRLVATPRERPPAKRAEARMGWSPAAVNLRCAVSSVGHIPLVCSLPAS